MDTPTVRRLLIDLEPPLPRHWCDGDAFLSAFFNALSMSFPIGEQFFIDAVRNGAQALPPAQAATLRAELQGFIGQEATHRHLHARFNRHLSAWGLVNRWETRAAARLAQLQGLDPRHALAITAANEHFTALFADWVLGHPRLLNQAEPRLAALWRWHSAEELEHKCTAFDLYRALGGDETWRRRWMRRVTLIFLSDLTRQTLSNLARDRQLWRLATWRSAWVHLFAPGGLLRSSLTPWRRYFQPDFHPSEHSTARGEAWLTANSPLFQAVSPTA